MFDDNSFMQKLQCKFFNDLQPQSKNYVLICAKICHDHYSHWPVNTWRRMEFPVLCALQLDFGCDQINIDYLSGKLIVKKKSEK